MRRYSQFFSLYKREDSKNRERRYLVLFILCMVVGLPIIPWKFKR